VGKGKVKSPRVLTMLEAALKESGENRAGFIRRFQKEHEVGSKPHLFKILNGSEIAGEAGLLPKIALSLHLAWQPLKMAQRADKAAYFAREKGLSANLTAGDIASLAEGLSPDDHRELIRLLERRVSD
jgi:hypothetical protein